MALCLACLTPCASFSQTTAVPAQSQSVALTRDPVAVAAVIRALTKLGSLKTANVDSLAIGELHNFRTNQTQAITIKTHGTDYLLNQVGSDFAFIRHGNDGVLRYGGNDHRAPTQSVAYQRAEHLPTLLLLSEIDSQQLQCKFVGTEDVQGITASHVRLSIVPKDGSSEDAQIEDLLSESHFWIDSSGQVVRARVFLFSPDAIQNRSPVDLYYSDYRSVAGFMAPFHVVREVDGQKDAELTFSSIDFGVHFTTADFR